MSNIENTLEYQFSKKILSRIFAKRSKLNHFDHVAEGLKILQRLQASFLTQQAYCIHPIIQNPVLFKKHTKELVALNAQAVALAVEFRNIATDPNKAPSAFEDINLMLIADKVQNFKAFCATCGTVSADDFSRLGLYFCDWLSKLGIDNARYYELIDNL